MKPESLGLPTEINQAWSMDFMPGQLEDGLCLLQRWAEKREILIDYIQPEKPQQNAHVERFNRTVRYKWLSQYY